MVDVRDPAQVAAIVGSAATTAIAMWKAMRSPRRKPPEENGNGKKRISQQEYQLKLEQALGEHGAALNDLSIRIVLVEKAVQRISRRIEDLIESTSGSSGD